MTTYSITTTPQVVATAGRQTFVNTGPHLVFLSYGNGLSERLLSGGAGVTEASVTMDPGGSVTAYCKGTGNTSSLSVTSAATADAGIPGTGGVSYDDLDPSVLSGLNATFVSKGLRRRDVPGLAGLITAMSSPPTVTDSTTSGLSGPIAWADRNDCFTFARRMAKKVSYPDSQYLWPIAATGANNTDGARVLPAFRVSFMTDAATFEVMCKGAGASMRVLVNGQYVTAGGGATITPTSDGSLHYVSVPLGSRALRRIDVDFANNGAFGGVRIGATDTLAPLPATTAPRLLVLGDSFAEGSNATASYSNFVYTLAAMLGCVPIPSGWGGTGYLNDSSGTKTTFRTRFTSDVVPEAPDVILYAGGINDAGNYTQAAIQAEAALLFAQGKAAFPTAQQFVLSPFWRNGVETFTTGLLGCRDAFKAAAVSAGMSGFIDLLELPLAAGQSLATTLSSAVSSGAGTASTAARYGASAGGNGQGFTVEVGTGTPNVERRVVTSWTGGGPFTLTPTANFGAAHSSGDLVNLVGSSLWTGSGKVGSTTGSGNSDILVSSDGTHPTQAGHDAIAYAIFNQLMPLLSP